VNESPDLWRVRASLFRMEVVVICKCKYVDITAAKKICSVSVSHSKVLGFFGSRLTLEVWCIALDKVCS